MPNLSILFLTFTAGFLSALIMLILIKSLERIKIVKINKGFFDQEYFIQRSIFFEKYYLRDDHTWFYSSHPSLAKSFKTAEEAEKFYLKTKTMKKL